MALTMRMTQFCQKMQSPVTMKEVKLTVRSHNYLFLQNQENFYYIFILTNDYYHLTDKSSPSKTSSGEIRNITLQIQEKDE